MSSSSFVELLYGKSELVRTQFLKKGTQIFSLLIADPLHCATRFSSTDSLWIS